jgi:sugar lactone lactonase YvrE
MQSSRAARARLLLGVLLSVVAVVAAMPGAWTRLANSASGARSSQLRSTGPSLWARDKVGPSASVAGSHIFTLAGGWLGDGGAATSATLSNPNEVAVDAAGNLYIADRSNHRIRKVAPDGVISTFAGTGLTGFSGDGGPASSARLNQPADVATDASGNVYIADTGNNRIRKITPDGLISTIAGSGAAGSSGDGGLAVNASFNAPEGLVVDSDGSLYVSESLGHRVRKFALGGTISTVAGTGTAGFSGDGGPGVGAKLNHPTGMSVDGAGNLFIADTFYHRIRKLAATGSVSTVAGDGTNQCGLRSTATTSPLARPYGVVLDGSGNLYVTNLCDSLVRVTPAGGIDLYAGNPFETGFSGDGGPATAALFNAPSGLAIDALGALYVADNLNQRVRKITAAGTISTVAGSSYSGDGAAAVGAEISHATDLAYDAAGNLFIAESGFNRIRKLTPDGVISTFAGNGRAEFSGDNGPAVEAGLNRPSGLAFDGAGNLFIADQENLRIRMITRDGMIQTVAGMGDPNNEYGDGVDARQAGLSHPSDVAIDAAGTVFVATKNRVRKFTLGGVFEPVAGLDMYGGFSGDGGTATAATLARPAGLAFDAAGNLLIADTDNRRIRRISNGIITTIAGNGTATFSGDGGPASAASFNAPRGLSVDANGNIYIADTGNHRIRKIAADGTISTLAGDGGNGFSGDGGLAIQSMLASPYAVVLDPAGNPVIADYANNRIRRVLPTADIPPAAPMIGLATAGAGQASVAFAAPAGNGGSAVTGYTVSSFPAGGSDTNAGSPGLNHVIAGLADGTTYRFSVRASNAAGIGAPSALSNAVVPDEQRVLVAIADQQLTEGQTGTRLLTLTVSLSQAAPVDVSFDVATVDGTAVAGSDYGSTQARITVPAGQTSVGFSVPLFGDAIAEGNEVFTVQLGNLASAGNLAELARASATATIVDDDDNSLSVISASFVEGDNGTSIANFVVSLASPAASAVSFDIATSDSTARAGSDYVAKALAGEVIPAGQTSHTFQVTLIGDTAIEADESFVVSLANVVGAVAADRNALGTIRDDDRPALWISDVAITEGTGGTRTAYFVIDLTHAVVVPVSFDIATANGSATAGQDYSAVNATGLVLPPGRTRFVAAVEILGDATDEVDETFTLTLARARGALLGRSVGNAIILDDD